MALELKMLQRSEIEEARWNGCVYYAHNSRPYAYTWYLDAACPDDWFGIIEGNYESVFPVVFQKKYGLTYLYQPFWCQQLGLFSVNVCSAARLKAFLNMIPNHYKFWNIQANHRNSILLDSGEWGVDKLEIKAYPNYVLNLRKDYEELTENYSKNLKRNLRKAEKANLLLASNALRFEAGVDFFRACHAREAYPFAERDFHALLRIMYQAQHRGQAQVLSVHQGEELLACAFLIHTPSRIINLCNASSIKGLDLQAMAFLFDGLIRQAANQARVLDFEGSRQEGVARFYASFGAENQAYPRLFRNALPWPLNHLAAKKQKV